jgi:arylsulfatase A-like enzyme
VRSAWRRLRAVSPTRALGSFLATLSLVAGGLAVHPPARSQEPPEQRPNILIVLSDDQRATDTMHVMPKTVRFVGEGGTRFDQFYATTPLCCPSRATLLTGRYAHNHFVQNNLLARNLVQESTLQYYLHRAGYHTAIAGKFLNGWPVRYVKPPYFDRWVVSHGGYYGKTFNINGTVRRVQQYSVDFVRDQAVKDLQRFEHDDDTPWFMYLAPAAPHSPYIAERRYVHSDVGRWEPSPAVTEEDRTDKPLYVQQSRQGLTRAGVIRTKQLRTLWSLDDLVGRLDRTLEALREDDNTLVFFLSDNGQNWGEHGLNSKRVPYTPAIHVPFFMKWDGHVAAGAVDDRLAGMVDVAPTVLDAAGLVPDPAYPFDGRSLLEASERSRLLVEHWTQPGKSVPDFASTRAPAFQYIEYYDSNGIVIAQEYYDLAADPWQLVNLLGDTDPTNDPSPDEIRALSEQLRRDRQCKGNACP